MQPLWSLAARPPPGFELIREIGRGAQTLVLLARRRERLVALKVATNPPEELPSVRARFYREASVLARLHHPALPAALEVGEVDGVPFVVREYIDGRPLSDVLEDGPLEEAAVLALGSALSAALAALHRAGFVHRDVKPANVMQTADGQIRLIDLGLVTRSTSRVASDGVAAGTLQYSAPEQTGVLRRRVDGRADLYSLGVVLFEAATGGPPFASRDPGELVRMHAVQTPPPVHQVRPSLSRGLSAIIEKLLRKEPDERYQSAAALMEDLARGEVSHSTLQSSPPPAEGALVGRGAQRSALAAAFERASKGEGSIVFIEGTGGAGKSRLAREALREASAQGFWSLSGKCEQGEPTPFAPLRAALESAVAQGAATPTLLARLREAIGEAGPYVARLSPTLAAPPPEAPPPLSEDQFYGLMAEVFAALGRQGPTVLFLDDLQWVDDGSAQVVLRLADLVAKTRLVVLLAARPQEEGDYGLRAQLAPLVSTRIELAPLDREAVAEWLRLQLASQTLPPDLLTQLMVRSDGNAFVLEELLRAVLDEGLLRPWWGEWVFHGKGLVELELPGEVFGLVLRRASQVGAGVRRVLSVAAVLGLRFGSGELTRLVEGEALDVAAALEEAREARLVEEEHGLTYAFVHDRVRESMLSALTPEDRRDLHLRAARTLDLPDATPETMFAIATHYARGGTERAPLEALRANVRAAQLSLSQYAYAQACTFFEQAKLAAVSAHVELGYDFHQPHAEALSRTGQLEAARAAYEAALTQAAEPEQRALVHGSLSLVEVGGLDFLRARAHMDQAYAALGVRAPRLSLWDLIASTSRWAAESLLNTIVPLEGRATEEQRRRLTLLATLGERNSIILYFEMNIPVMAFDLMAMRGRSLRLATSRGRCLWLAGAGIILALFRRVEQADACSREAVAMAERLGDAGLLAHVRLFRGLTRHFLGHVVEAQALERECIERHGHWLDDSDYLSGCGDLTWSYALRGHFHDALDFYERAMRRTEVSNSRTPLLRGNAYRSMGGFLAAAVDQPLEAVRVFEEVRAHLAETPKDLYRWGKYAACLALHHLELGELGRPFDDALALHRGLKLHAGRIPLQLRHFYIAKGYGLARRYAASEAGQRAALRGSREQLMKELDVTARHPTLRTHREVIRGLFALADGAQLQARRFLGDAEALAHEIDSPWVLYEVARVRARTLKSTGKDTAALREARRAHQLAVDHRWPRRARALREEFGLVEASRTARSFSTGSGGHATDSTVLRLRRHADALLQVSLASVREPRVGTVARMVLDEAAAIVGAERGLLFLASEDTGALELSAARAGRADLDTVPPFSRTVVEQARVTREPVILTGSDQGGALASESVVAHELRSVAAVPLLAHDKLLGVVYLDNRLVRGLIAREDLDILVALSNHIAVALEAARSAELERHVEAEKAQRVLAERLRANSEQLSASLDRTVIGQQLVQALLGLIDADRCLLLLCEGRTVRAVAAEGAQGVGVPIEVGGALGGHLEPEQHPVIERLLRAEQSPTEDRELERVVPRALEPDFAGEALLARLSLRGEVLGAFVLTRRERRRFTERDADVLAIVTAQASNALDNARLYADAHAQATTDPLTGAFNRRHFFALAERALHQTWRAEGAYALMLIDVDRFKAVNDTHGHQVGDEVLCELVRRLSGQLRAMDVLARFGGEEFIVLLPEADHDGALNAAERLAQHVRETPFDTRVGPLAVSISVGVAEGLGPSEPLGALIKRADEAVYAAKRQGRDRVIMAAA